VLAGKVLGQLQHFRRDINCSDLSAALCEVHGRLPQTGSNIQHPFSAKIAEKAKDKPILLREGTAERRSESGPLGKGLILGLSLLLGLFALRGGVYDAVLLTEGIFYHEQLMTAILANYRVTQVKFVYPYFFAFRERRSFGLRPLRVFVFERKNKETASKPR